MNVRITPLSTQIGMVSGADLEGAHLRDANLVDATLSVSHLEGAHLNRADLYGADLYGAKNTTPSQLSRALSLSGTIMPDGTKNPCQPEDQSYCQR